MLAISFPAIQVSEIVCPLILRPRLLVATVQMHQTDLHQMAPKEIEALKTTYRYYISILFQYSAISLLQAVSLALSKLQHKYSLRLNLLRATPKVAFVTVKFGIC